MALLHVTYFSQALSGQNDFYAVLPNDLPPMMTTMPNPAFQRPMKTLVLLHGHGGAAADWLTGSGIQELATKYNLAVLMPNGRNSFYLDKEASGEGYGTFIGEELLSYARKTFGLSDKAEDTFIGGFSMGGFGALRNGLKYSQNYSKIMAFSSAIITKEVHEMDPARGNMVANYAYYAATFGDPATVLERDADPAWLVKQKLAAGEKLPGIYMACGTDDMLLPVNQEFAQVLTENDVPFIFKVSKGMHDWTFWNTYLEPAIQWMLEE